MGRDPFYKRKGLQWRILRAPATNRRVKEGRRDPATSKRILTEDRGGALPQAKRPQCKDGSLRQMRGTQRRMEGPLHERRGPCHKRKIFRDARDCWNGQVGLRVPVQKIKYKCFLLTANFFCPVIGKKRQLMPG